MQDATEDSIEEVCKRAEIAAEAGDFAAAREALEGSVAEDSTGECAALLGLACFQLGDYRAAALNYLAALARRPDHEGWQHMRARAEENAEASINLYVPPVVYYDRETLLAPPQADAGLPPPPPPLSVGTVRRVRMKVATAFAYPISTAVDLSTWAVGGLLGYRDAVWTNWYRKHL
ncbi:MAG: hypothetical protein ABIP13_10960, partial [Tepidiformaceae bacterium]